MNEGSLLFNRRSIERFFFFARNTKSVEGTVYFYPILIEFIAERDTSTET
jgi:hypothetical protein